MWTYVRTRIATKATGQHCSVRYTYGGGCAAEVE